MESRVARRSAPTFALIIGIDEYAHFRKLQGAVADAVAMKQYLEEVLQMPKDHIVTLYNDEATRIAIIDILRGLPNDQRINKGDPIVIFYAGHGGELTAPPAWRVKNKIQCLVPQDCEAAVTELNQDRAPIPDRTIGVLLEDIAKQKGDNITVIFDCCHSASGTRKGYLPRSVTLNINIPETLDTHIWKGRAGTIANGFAYHGLRSHILLAACGEKESAYEDDRRGQFTTALLKTLESCVVGKLDLTYAEVMERIHLKQQRPQCEGLNRHRILYDTRVPAGRQLWYLARASVGKYVIDAGLSHGVAPGVKFTLYNDQKLWLGVVFVDEASSINDFETIVTTSSHVEDVSFAKLTRVGSVPLCIGSCPLLEETLQRMDGNGGDVANFRVVEKVADAKLQLELAKESDLVIFKILDQRAQKLGLTELPHKATFDILVQVLGAAAHYFWYLDLENKNSRLGTNHEVAVNFYFLNKYYDDIGQPFLVPDESKPAFCRRDPSSGNSNVIDFDVDPTGRYGIEIKNNTRKDLHLNAFLFNNSSLSITACYTQSSSGKPEVPLKQGGTFTIGYGTGGAAPLSFSLEKGQDVDVGYLKLFFSTRPIDLSDIEQSSPFSKLHPPPRRGLREGVQSKGPPSARDVWFTVLIPVVQRRGTTSAAVR